jgi:hypothetical protein
MVGVMRALISLVALVLGGVSPSPPEDEEFFVREIVREAEEWASKS